MTTSNSSGPAHQVNQIIKAVVDAWSSQIEMSAASVARETQLKIHPYMTIPVLSDYLENMQLRQMARAVLRTTADSDENLDHTTEDLFGDALQVRYPTTRNGELSYVKREYLTYEERMENVRALRMEAEAKLRHADALEAETEYLVKNGTLDKAA